MVYCAECGDSISGSYTSYNGQYYHSGCFKCSSCGTELTNRQFYIQSGEIQCNSCYTENSAPKCRKCKKPFPPYVQYKVLPEGYYHNECFCCEGPCERPMPGSFYTIRNKRICSSCYQNYGNDFEKYIKKKEEPKPEPKPEPIKEPPKKRVPIYY